MCVAGCPATRELGRFARDGEAKARGRRRRERCAPGRVEKRSNQGYCARNHRSKWHARGIARRHWRKRASSRENAARLDDRKPRTGGKCGGPRQPTRRIEVPSHAERRHGERPRLECTRRRRCAGSEAFPLIAASPHRERRRMHSVVSRGAAETTAEAHAFQVFVTGRSRKSTCLSKMRACETRPS